MSTGDKIKGAAQETIGKAKRAVGDAIDNERLEGEGMADQAKGKARQESAKAGERVRGHAEQTGGKIKNAVGDLIDDPKMEAEGKAEELKGSARRTANR